MLCPHAAVAPTIWLPPFVLSVEVHIPMTSLAPTIVSAIIVTSSSALTIIPIARWIGSRRSWWTSSRVQGPSYQRSSQWRTISSPSPGQLYLRLIFCHMRIARSVALPAHKPVLRKSGWSVMRHVSRSWAARLQPWHRRLSLDLSSSL